MYRDLRQSVTATRSIYRDLVSIVGPFVASVLLALTPHNWLSSLPDSILGSRATSLPRLRLPKCAQVYHARVYRNVEKSEKQINRLFITAGNLKHRSTVRDLACEDLCADSHFSPAPYQQVLPWSLWRSSDSSCTRRWRSRCLLKFSETSPATCLWQPGSHGSLPCSTGAPSRPEVGRVGIVIG